MSQGNPRNTRTAIPEQNTIGTTTDAHGRPVVSKPAGASNDIVHLDSVDVRTVTHTGDPMQPRGRYMLPSTGDIVSSLMVSRKREPEAK